MDQITDCLPGIIINIHNDICNLEPYPRGAQQAPYPADAAHYEEWHHIQQQQVQDEADNNHLLWFSTHPPRFEAWPN